VPLGYWVLRKVCEAIQAWKKEGLPVVPVSVNVSARQFQQPVFHQQVAAVLAEYGIEPGLIELEMTEGLLMDDSDSALRELRHLKQIGVRISVDDFGTGHSCLNYLRRFPIDVLKIDRSFVQDIGTSEDSEIIIDAIISLARSLRLETVAEGVEKDDQVEYLLDRGCRVAQGFLLGMPMPEADVRPLLKELQGDPDITGTIAMPGIKSAGLGG
jgi:EAL domain-containing protein (putative c-di-GMP-specific phosphodiesterase class I)